MRQHKKSNIGTVGMDYKKHQAVIDSCIPLPTQPINIPQSPHPSQSSYVQHSYPTTKKIPKSKRFQKD